MTKSPKTLLRARKAQGRQPSAKSAATRQKILEAATLEFARNGYGATRLSDIADSLGIHLSGLYYYFDTKEELASQVIGQVPFQAAGAIDAVLAELPQDVPTLDRLKAAIQVYLRFILRDNEHLRANVNIAREAPPEVRDQALAITREESNVFRKLIEEASKAGSVRDDVDLTMARMVLFGAMNWSIEWFVPGRLSPDEFADQLIEIIFNGIKR